MRRISWYHVSFIRETFHTFITFGVSNHSQFIAIGEIEELLWQMRFVAVKLIDNFDGDRWILLLFPTVCAENKLVILLAPQQVSEVPRQIFDSGEHVTGQGDLLPTSGFVFRGLLG
jgi:hypothetical protein